MSALIILYIFSTENFAPARIFRILFPVIWGLYTIILLFSIAVQKRFVMVFVSNDWVLKAANLLCVICFIMGYTFYVHPVKQVSLQQSSLTVFVVFLMFLYIWATFRERCKSYCNEEGSFTGYKDLDDLLNTPDLSEK